MEPNLADGFYEEKSDRPSLNYGIYHRIFHEYFTVLGAVYTCTNTCTIPRTIPCTICRQARYGSNSSTDTHYNGLNTHFSKKIIKLTCRVGKKSYVESYTDLYLKLHV
jgi:hypothetical protein